MTHDPVNDLHALSDELLETARTASSGQAARTVFGEAHQTLHQTLIALLAGQGLAEHGNPGQATVQVLRGSLTLDYGSEVMNGSLGALLAVPQHDHSVTALQDTVLLLTVAKLEH
jgi:quercetin dioxygenase-like cupin family protein